MAPRFANATQISSAWRFLAGQAWAIVTRHGILFLSFTTFIAKGFMFQLNQYQVIQSGK
jgi:hypothetical protein